MQKQSPAPLSNRFSFINMQKQSVIYMNDAFVYTVMWKGLWNITNISFYPQITFLALFFLPLLYCRGLLFLIWCKFRASAI